MFDRLDSRRLRRALTLLLLFLSQLTAIAASAQPACPRADCEDETPVATVLADAPVEDEAHPPACQIAVSSCSIASFCVPVVEAAYFVAGCTTDDSARHDRLPLGRAVPPLYGPPRT